MTVGKIIPLWFLAVVKGTVKEALQEELHQP
jgi:hypothetical protein